MAFTALPSQEVLRQLLRYEPETGKMFWRERSPEMFMVGRNSREHRCRMFNRNFATTEALTTHNVKGYLVGAVLRKTILAHRVIWKWQTGHEPRGQIDHINGVTSDNRWINLREAEQWQNSGNRRKMKGSVHSKYVGVCRAKKTGLFTAAISRNGKQVHLGSFRCETAAAVAYIKAATEKYGPFRRKVEAMAGGVNA